MATFSRGLIQGLINPSYSQNLRDVGMLAGSAPGRRRERERQEGMFRDINQALFSEDPEKILSASQQLARTDPQGAMRLALEAKGIQSTQRTREGQGALAYLQDQMRRTLQADLADDFTAADQQAQLNNLQASANAVAANIKGIDPLATAGMSMNMENAVFQQKSARNQERRAEEALELRFKGHEMALDRHKEYMETADYRKQMQGFEVNEANYNAAIRSAKSMPNTPEAKAAFLQNENFSEMEGVWDAVSAQKESQRLQLEQLEANAEDNKFDYTDEQLFDLLGTPEDERTKDSAAGKANLKAISRLRALPPKRANAVLQSAVESSFAKTKAPPAALVGLFKDAAMAYTAGQRFTSEEEEEGQAAQLALKAAQAYMEAGSGVGAFQAALEVMAIEAEGVTGDKQPESTAELIKQLQQLETQYPDNI
tara:strand:+ start:4137 stop:5417 length:1281 start_codon:yes stop_codon:yes gene_type:complete